MLLRKNSVKLTLLVAFAFLFQSNLLAQGNKFSWNNDNASKDNIYMTWNKNTPESEMKDDIKALAEHGVTIKYSNLKRNSKGEITAIKMEYFDKHGNKGSMQLDNLNPINTIKFYKQGDEVGFGEPSGNDMIASNDFFNNFGGDRMKQFNFNFDNDSLQPQKFNFSFPDGQSFGQSKSKIIIKKDGKKPLIIEDGEVIEGAEDYTQEEIEEIKKNNRVEGLGNGQSFNFNFDSDSMDSIKEQMERMQNMFPNSKGDKIKIERNFKSNDDDLEKTKDEMLKAKEEMLKAKEEMQNAKKELEKAKSSLKTQKA